MAAPAQDLCYLLRTEPIATWQRAAQIPRLAPLKAQRDAHFARRPLRRASEDEDCSLDFHLAALRQAGFAEAATVWQQLDNYVVFARLAQA